jgi:glycosyltransferase involved in cell wall biosynthesis
VNKKIAIIGTVGLPARYGGFETLTEYLTLHLNEKYDLTVYCSSKNYNKQPNHYNGAKLVYIPLNANGIQSIPYDIVSIFKALRYADTLLILGVSGCIALPIIKFFTHKRIVVNIDGLEWKREKWSGFAKWFLKLSESLAVKYADTVVTDNKVIQDYVKTIYSKNSVLIAYGADHVQKLDFSQEQLNKYTFLSQPYAFTVCRIEPENNLHIILNAMSQQKELPLVIIGNWDSSQYGRELINKYSSFEHIHQLDPIYNQNILNEIRSNCCIYLHGHSAGGTNPSLVEAMYLGLPIFAYAVNYNKETTEHDACYFSNTEELSSLINTLNINRLGTIGDKMAEIAHRKYRWQIICQKYIDIL